MEQLTLQDLTPETLKDLYSESLLTDQQIADLYRTTQATISRKRLKWGIPTLGKRGRLDQVLPDLSEYQSQILIGSLLGDGHLFTRTEGSAGFSEGHAWEQREYTQWKHDQLGDFSLGLYPGGKKTSSKYFKSLSVRTHTCTHLWPYYEMFYPAPERIRVFPKELPQLITPVALAVWYMDDGSLYRRFHPRISFGLCDTSLRRALKGMGLHPVKYGEDGNVNIHFRPEDSETFFELISPHVPECMRYKLPEPPSDRVSSLRVSYEVTPQMVGQLYGGGMSIQDIASVYGLGLSTIRRKLHHSGVPIRKSGPRSDQVSVSSAELALQGIDDSDVAFNILSKTSFPYDEFPDSDITEDFRKLKNLEPCLDDEGFIRPQSWRGTTLCKRFFPNRYRAVSTTSGVSAYEAWHLDLYLKRAIGMQLRYGDPVTPHRVLRAITAQLRTPTVFRPVVARYLYETYAGSGSTVWDPCAGYGGRLLGAAAAGVRYIGTDVDPDTVEGNRQLAVALGYEDYEVVHCPAEEFDCPQVDFVFTSPPYFDRERYLGSDQSWKSYPTLDRWLSGFLLPMMTTAFRALSAGGRMAINIADLKEKGEVVPLVEKTMSTAVQVGFKHEVTLKMPISNLGREAGYEPVLVFIRP